MPRHQIILVEDDPADAALLEKLIGELRPDTNVIVLADGDIALDYLAKHRAEEDPLRPALVIVDLNLPSVDGFAVLEVSQKMPELHDVPKVVLSSSTHESDVKMAYELGCSSYLVKPMTLDGYRRMLKDLLSGWLATNPTQLRRAIRY